MSSRRSYDIIDLYTVDKEGLPLNYLGFKSFDCTARPWYLQAKKSLRATWTAPFIQTNNAPAVSYTVPILNISYFGSTGFVGAMAVNVQLDQLSKTLKSYYYGTTTNVFIVDKASSCLIASSLSAQLVTTSGSTVTVSNQCFGTTSLTSQLS